MEPIPPPCNPLYLYDPRGSYKGVVWSQYDPLYDPLPYTTLGSSLAFPGPFLCHFEFPKNWSPLVVKYFFIIKLIFLLRNNIF